jgi:hypothetical protein
LLLYYKAIILFLQKSFKCLIENFITMFFEGQPQNLRGPLAKVYFQFW